MPEKGEAVVLACGSDGQSPVTPDAPARSFGIGTYGSVEPIDRGPVADVLRRGTILAEAAPLEDAGGVTFGLRLATDRGDVLHIFNWGDQLHTSRELPDSVVAVLRRL